ncbi:MAG TPA: hypothetical protein ENK18_23600 [Deltaproteobacteria bacterium]|nr:hypothetical protein [Deltaproteobacteria bacterium]
MSRDDQLIALLLRELQEHPKPWWNAELMREAWSTYDRLRWLDAEPDLRAEITHTLAGLPLVAAQTDDIEFQADLIERVLESGAISLQAWEEAFSPELIAAHGPKAAIWQEFREQFPWEDPSEDDRDLLVWLLSELLEEREEGGRRSSIMSPLYIRSAIDVRIWQECIPLDVRVQVDGRRLRKELEGKHFTCRDELAVVKLERIVEHIPLEHLRGVFDALERVLPGLAQPETPVDDDDHEATESAHRI